MNAAKSYSEKRLTFKKVLERKENQDSIHTVEEEEASAFAEHIRILLKNDTDLEVHSINSKNLFEQALADGKAGMFGSKKNSYPAKKRLSNH